MHKKKQNKNLSSENILPTFQLNGAFSWSSRHFHPDDDGMEHSVSSTLRGRVPHTGAIGAERSGLRD